MDMRSSLALYAESPDTQAQLPISGIVITRNEADRIARCIASMTEVCNEIVVLDSGSTDTTVAIARRLGARVERLAWRGFAAQKNAAIALASQPWVLLLCDALGGHPQARFYGALAQFTRAFVSVEAQGFDMLE